ncbi:DMSO/TMAO reductase YedYZ molybdopterin-dependent catalytic subunit [Tamaricihabitans halophyticus]|uniref:DMSO/TMAO reductase YedYZ molybdopterin-dependent catalytic subunit n=1 Tax=Tamaricihabitans halophyticus TaxID=1262583 RepID=A0A4V2SU68_9PSEU|nr:molybdopterin-dependent oxidoreductase [Tamaricihabitans halophyticus]TCP53026.1 DMSO/TMAO reductase YedYZ molybdopterin-dependent catalytic subunit [Tamaricihabitans halophyticus]
MKRISLIPRQSRFRAAAHDERVAAKVGVWLGIAFLVCFVTGMLSYAIQYPPSWFYWPSRPVNLYRVTQGLHVLAGIAAIPLLAAKLWSVFPKLFARPMVRSLPHAIERGSILLLSGSVIFELVTGLFNVAQNYPWRFFFPTAHRVVGWLAVGAILVHIAIKLPIVRRALSKEARAASKATNDQPSQDRRRFLRTTWLATGVAVAATAGSTVPLLRNISPLAWRSTEAPQGVPVNRTAKAANVIGAATAEDWRLVVQGSGRAHQFGLADLAALPQRTAELPIACVEGWSQSASWTGVSIPELLHAVGAAPGSELRVISMEPRGRYARSTLPGSHTDDPLSLLALRVNGERLSLDHGYPCRIIAPNRPGVLQTKWVQRLVVQ